MFTVTTMMVPAKVGARPLHCDFLFWLHLEVVPAEKSTILGCDYLTRLFRKSQYVTA